MTTYTNVGLTLIATAFQTPGANVAITYVALGTGCGALASGLTSGSVYTALPLAAPLSAALSIGQSLTLINTNNVDTQVVTVASPGASLGATSIPVTSFTASATFATGAGVTTTPSATDTALFAESYRVAAVPGAAGGQPGESLNGGYFDSTTPSATYTEVGYFGGSTASATLGTGTLLARDVEFWAHTVGTDSAAPQLDTKHSLT